MRSRRHGETVLRLQLYIVSIGSIQPFPQAPYVNAHEVSAAETELAFTATGKRVETNLITRPYPFDTATGFNYDAGSVSSENVWHRDGHSGDAKTRPYVDVVERGGFQFNNSFAGRSYCRLRCIFIAKLIASAMLMYSNRVQLICPPGILRGVQAQRKPVSHGCLKVDKARSDSRHKLAQHLSLGCARLLS
jgi:hypothetical protein